MGLPTAQLREWRGDVAAPPEREELCERLAWDSQFFGFNIERLRGGRLTYDRAAEAVRWCRDHKVRCLYFLAGATDPRTLEAATERGFQRTGLRCTYECELSRWRPACSSPAVRPFEPEDLPALERMAAVNHSDSRFYSDTRFDRKRCDDLFAAWIRNSCAAASSTVLVAGFAGSPAGYIICQSGEAGRGSIGLAGVQPEYRRNGLARQLVNAALAHLREKGVRGVNLTTHGDAAAQQLCERSGFLIQNVEIWYHLWPAAAPFPAARGKIASSARVYL